MARLQRNLKRSRVKYCGGASGLRVSRGIQGTRITGRRVRAGGVSSGTDHSRWALSQTDTTGVVTIGEGSILKGSWLECDAANVTVSGGSSTDPHYIYCELNLTTNGVSIIGNAVAAKPTGDATTMRFILHAVYLSGTTVVHVAQHQASDIILDKVYA